MSEDYSEIKNQNGTGGTTLVHFADVKWIGVDFDQTLRKKDGNPVEPMVARVKLWLSYGIQVRIVSARMAPARPGTDPEEQRYFIQHWCRRYIGKVLPVQWGKSSGMLELWDDKVVTVEPETGKRLSPSRIDV